ncbi:gag-pol polyprotein [Tanacetum coccineum]
MRTRRSKTGTVTPFAIPKRQFRIRREVSPTPIHNIYTFYESESSESDTENVDIESLTLEQYLALDQNNTRRRFTCPDDSTFEIKGQLRRELHKMSFSGGLTDSAIEHISKVLEIASIFKAQESTLVQRFCPPAMIFKQLSEIRNFKQEDEESLFDTWERYNDLLFKCPFHDLNDHQKVNTFYNGLNNQTRQTVDTNGLIPGLTASDALKSIQNLVEHSHKWHCKENYTTTPDPLRIITEKLKLLNYKMEELTVDFRKLNTDDVRSSYYAKVKSIKSSKINYDRTYTESSNRPTHLKDKFEQCLKESSERQANQNELMKKIMISTDLSLKNHDSSIKRLEQKSPKGIKDNILVKIRNFVFPVDFVILDIMEDENVLIILGRPMLATAHAKIDVYGKKISLGVGNDQIVFNINKKESPTFISPIYIINKVDKTQELNDLVMNDEKLRDFKNYLSPEYGSQDIISLSPSELAEDKEEFSMTLGINMLGLAKNLRVFIGNHQFLVDFIILKNISEFVEKGLTEVLFGQHFKEQIGLVEDWGKGTLWFKIVNDKTIFHMPRAKKACRKLTVKQHNSIGPLLKVNDKDKKRGIHKPEKKIKGFYRGWLSLGNEYKYDQEVVDWIQGCIDDGMTIQKLKGNSRDWLDSYSFRNLAEFAAVTP